MVTGKQLMQDRAEGMRVRDICKKHNISNHAFYQLVIPLGYKVKKRTTFKPIKTKKWKVHNRILYGLILSLGTSMLQISNDIGVDIRTLERWIYEGVVPKGNNLKKACEYFKYPPNILFYETDIEREVG